MTLNEYQQLASRTMDNGLDVGSIEYHALHGMVGEIGELHSIYQKHYQGHDFDVDHALKEVGDLLWFIAEYCSALGVKLDDVANTNIEKLKKRYPNGFESVRSLVREEGDV